LDGHQLPRARRGTNRRGRPLLLLLLLPLLPAFLLLSPRPPPPPLSFSLPLSLPLLAHCPTSHRSPPDCQPRCQPPSLHPVPVALLRRPALGASSPACRHRTLRTHTAHTLHARRHASSRAAARPRRPPPEPRHAHPPVDTATEPAHLLRAAQAELCALPVHPPAPLWTHRLVAHRTRTHPQAGAPRSWTAGLPHRAKRTRLPLRE
jgi:hypothetical protein